MPPARESNTLSVSNWRTMRARPAPSAERIANSRLRTGGAHQQQIGDIGAGDQQHQPYRAQHHQQRITRVADDAVAQWSNRKVR